MPTDDQEDGPLAGTMLEGRDAATEAESDGDGFLSYSKEWHALIVGLGAGFLAGLSGRYEIALGAGMIALGSRTAPTDELEQLSAEPWYTLGGLLAGYAAGTAARLAHR